LSALAVIKRIGYTSTLQPVWKSKIWSLWLKLIVSV